MRIQIMSFANCIAILKKAAPKLKDEDFDFILSSLDRKAKFYEARGISPDPISAMEKAAQEFAPSVQESVERAAGELTALWTPERWDTAFRAAKSFRDADAKRIFTLDVAAQLAS